MDGSNRVDGFMKKTFMDMVAWIRPTFEGQDGKASFRRFSALTLIILDIYLVVCDKLSESDRLNVYFANLVTVLLIIGIVTTQNILEFFNRGKKDSDGQ